MTVSRQEVDISVCIANYNGGAFVLHCLKSVYAQDGNFSIEILVHDDASTDNSLELIRTHYPDARVIAASENAGFCVSNNRLAGLARGRFLLFLNNDASLRPGSLGRLFAFSQLHDDSIIGLAQYAMGDGHLVDRGYWTDPFLNPIPQFDAGSHTTGVVTGACLWVPKQVWEEVGGFPPWFESVAEDIFLCMAARLLGHDVYLLDAPAFDHWVGSNLGGGKLVDGKLQTTTRRRALTERNKTFAMLCCYPWPALIILFPIHVLLLTCEAMFLMATGLGVQKARRIYADILPSVLRRKNEILRLRHSLMSQRRKDMPSVFAFTRWYPQKLAMLVRHGRPSVR